ncbi:uncharacterized protein P174DRAFT_116745 [Aspergillus novofumigatus IBT 16806]|uniref:Uncharacterized protein n=1 Tax=Aspergillus novofumigatus (strain IBT 16806) TaxID=1392255 RepID=A0A2I1CJE5_ASPN1|nr:uncharacterized protein P174DRAFT_116745 [Aspergillus novofumigatus IBT 16806]PKX97748.1 hypothetical protein P174DRAFT_116745 [Aspergillus novofumigatus IBT 16806]
MRSDNTLLLLKCYIWYRLVYSSAPAEQLLVLLSSAAFALVCPPSLQSSLNERDIRLIRRQGDSERTAWPPLKLRDCSGEYVLARATFWRIGTDRPAARSH